MADNRWDNGGVAVTVGSMNFGTEIESVARPRGTERRRACPDDNIYVYVNGSAHDRTPYIFVELNASNLHDCIRKCFGNQFCYSLKFDERAVERCSLYYFAAYNCSRQDLVLASSVRYAGGSVTIDFTAPPFDTVTDQSIVALDGKGQTIFSKPLVKEVTNNIESKLAAGENVYLKAHWEII
ncbi:unnamed protein product [Nippostrongylus brasiliensis]|uniref:Apple domain-containing protein n=1 Tax=Nippostrongylus brasiliensis TaxID=27835 RepID=A0A158R2Z3_NIPBR|nr:unnamed protein product [Nippostrongylus brasiliensis]